MNFRFFQVNQKIHYCNLILLVEYVKIKTINHV